MAAKPPSALAATKAVLLQTEEGRISTQMEEEFKLFSEQLRDPEAAEALLAFAEKRRADFSRFLAKVTQPGTA